MAPRALTFVFAATVIPVLVSFLLSAGPPSAYIGAGTASDAGAPAAALEANFTEGGTHSGTCHPFTENVTLMGSASGGVPPYNFTWSFGPGSSLSYGPETNHTYTATGSYNVTLSVTDIERDTDSVTQTVGVPPPSGCPLPIVGGPSSSLPWQFYALLGGTGVGFALLGVVVWSRRK
jgi:PKD repeat protein